MADRDSIVQIENTNALTRKLEMAFCVKRRNSTIQFAIFGRVFLTRGNILKIYKFVDLQSVFLCSVGECRTKREACESR